MSTIKPIEIPDLGTSAEVDVIEIMVKVGDKITQDTPILTLESDKASMEVPSPMAGTVKEVLVKQGDKVKNGQKVMMLEVSEVAVDKETKKEPSPEKPVDKSPAKAAEKTEKKLEKTEPKVAKNVSVDELYAGPAVRRLARELDLDLSQIQGSGDKHRITKEDVKQFVQSSMAGKGGANFSAPMPAIDFSQFGEIETVPLTKIKKISGANLQRNWVTIPHVTQFEDVDITELEAFRVAHKELAEKQGFKLTLLVFIMKAVVTALKKYPNFNSSLDPTGQHLILKHYYNLGVAVDTPNGLVVAVIKDVDKKGLLVLGKELADISEKARTKGLSIADMQGASFTISSLGGIGGTAFTPIVNSPEVAILGVSKAAMKPIYQAEQWVPRLILPLSLSYDHRVIDGAQGARFTSFLMQTLTDIRTILL